MSYKPYFLVQGQWATNAQAFATHGEAWNAACDRFQRWTVPTEFDARESDEPVNYIYDFETREERHVPSSPDPNQSE